MSASAGESGKHAVPELDLLPQVECTVPEHSLVQFTRTATSPPAVGDREVVEENQLSRLQTNLGDHGIEGRPR
jgi:hypothetical protein